MLEYFGDWVCWRSGGFNDWVFSLLRICVTLVVSLEVRLIGLLACLAVRGLGYSGVWVFG